MPINSVKPCGLEQPEKPKLNFEAQQRQEEKLFKPETAGSVACNPSGGALDLVA